ncbi:hypothetical protein MRX96_029858 [Rhipicephalus microplus]
MINGISNGGKVPESLAIGNLISLPKGGKDSRQPGSWRPITVASPPIFDDSSTRLDHLAPLVHTRLLAMRATSAVSLHPQRHPRIPHRPLDPGLRDIAVAMRLLLPHVWCGTRHLQLPGRGASSPSSIDEPAAFMYMSPNSSFTPVRSASIHCSPASSAAIPVPPELVMCKPSSLCHLAITSRGPAACRRCRIFVRPRVTKAAGLCVADATPVVCKA